jgi:hypothetical protein
VERLPFMITPKWVNTRSQPIAIGDVLRYLVGCLADERTTGESLDIGGAEVLTYREMMLGFTRVRGLKRVMVPVPVLSPRLSSYWVDLITPIPASYARPLIEGLKNEVVVKDDRIRALIPFEPMRYEDAVRVALERESRGEVETRWTEASRSEVVQPVAFTGREIVDDRVVVCAASPEAAWRAVSGIGGRRGWYAFNFLWTVRGAMDRMAGGVGMRRGRRDPDELRGGDALDFWRVESLRPGEELVLRAEMKVPGEAWLEFRVAPDAAGSRIEQRARFRPAPFWGRAYWYSLLPMHAIVFRGMLHAIARRAERSSAKETA